VRNDGAAGEKFLIILFDGSAALFLASATAARLTFV
jgi:hypothetical protein